MDIMTSCPVRHVRAAKLRRGVFSGTVPEPGIFCVADTQFWVDHGNIPAEIEFLKGKCGWGFGNLPEGCEFVWW